MGCARASRSVIPELVSTNEEARTKSVNYQGLVPVLINAFKEQQSTLMDFETTIATQEAELAQRLNAIEQQQKRLNKLRVELNAQHQLLTNLQ